MTQQAKASRPRLRGVTRVRLEYSATALGGSVGFKTDKKLSLLKVILSERFGAPGEQAYRDWLLANAVTQAEGDLVKEKISG